MSGTGVIKTKRRMYRTRSRWERFVNISMKVLGAAVQKSGRILCIAAAEDGNANREVTGYPTQKPLALLERIIKASSQ